MVYVSDHNTVVKAEAVSRKTVSYTHLDVYKRQEYSRPVVFGEDRLRERGSLSATFYVLNIGMENHT